MHFIDPVTWHKLPSYLVTIILPFVPDLIAKINLHTSTKLRLAYSLFLVIAMVFGIDLDWYKNLIIFGYPSYDKIVHTLSGVFSAFLAKEILDNVYDGKESAVKSTSTSGTSAVKIKKYSTAFAFLFIVSFVFFVAAAWECFEFSYDQLCGGHMQELNAPGVGDTMGDIISAGIGGIIFAFFLRKK
jgi:membrane protein